MITQLNGDLSNKSNVGHGHDVIAGMDNSGHSLQFKWTGSDLQFYVDKQGPFFSTANFQAGVDTLYSKCNSCGATPSAKTPTAIAGAIDKIYTDRYNEGYNAGYDASAIGGFLGTEYSLTNTTDLSIPFSNYSGNIIIALELHWQYGISGDATVNISPSGWELIYQSPELVGGGRSGGYEHMMVVKANIDSIANKTLNLSVSGVNSTVKQYTAFIFRANT